MSKTKEMPLVTIFETENSSWKIGKILNENIYVAHNDNSMEDASQIGWTADNLDDCAMFLWSNDYITEEDYELLVNHERMA